MATAEAPEKAEDEGDKVLDVDGCMGFPWGASVRTGKRGGTGIQASGSGEGWWRPLRPSTISGVFVLRKHYR